MQRLFLYFIIAFLFVISNSSISQAQALSGIGPESIWKPGDEKIAQMREECAKDIYPVFEKCLIENTHLIHIKMLFVIFRLKADLGARELVHIRHPDRQDDLYALARYGLRPDTCSLDITLGFIQSLL